MSSSSSWYIIYYFICHFQHKTFIYAIPTSPHSRTRRKSTRRCAQCNSMWCSQLSHHSARSASYDRSARLIHTFPRLAYSGSEPDRNMRLKKDVIYGIASPTGAAVSIINLKNMIWKVDFNRRVMVHDLMKKL